jgi:hypothetical protein
MRLSFGQPDALSNVELKGAVEDPKTPTVLNATGIVPYWGLVNQMELRIFRDGVRVFDISTTNLGVSEIEGKGIYLKLECHDPGIQNVKDHTYSVRLDVSFYSCQQNIERRPLR